MKVEIWSDIMCPFCYIGKRKFEAALAEFEGKDEVEIEWKSYQLDPNMVSNPNQSALEYLAERKGQSLEWSEQAHAHVTAMAKAVGLDYHFEKAVVANSKDAHRLIQFAKTQGLGDAIEERLFKAYFEEGADIADFKTLTLLAADIGLDVEAIRQVLNSDQYSDEVAQDILFAREIGVQGVPFFVFDRKYAVSGAQEPAFFLKTMQKAAEMTELGT